MVRIYEVSSGTTRELEKVERSEDEWRRLLDPETFRVARLSGTEPAFTGRYHDFHGTGLYRCVCCGTDLFRSESKFDSGSGWPSFTAPVSGNNIRMESDRSFGMVRNEVRCARCDAHLGHVFDDGPPPTRLRFCMNSATLVFVPD